jgi:hypothetical protein
LRDFHFTRWAELFHRVIQIIMQKLRLHTRKALISYMIRHNIADGIPRVQHWGTAYKHALNRYFGQFGGHIRPEYVTLNPPNSTLALASRLLFDRLLRFNPELNSAIYKGLKDL